MSFILSNPSTFSRQIRKVQTQVFDAKKSFLLFVHADWCGYCKMMKPEWDKFVKGMKSESKGKGKDKENNNDSHSHLSNLALIEVKDTVVQNILQGTRSEMLKDIIQKTVSGYPTILLGIQNASKNDVKIFMFDGERNKDGLDTFIIKHLKEINTGVKNNVKETKTRSHSSEKGKGKEKAKENSESNSKSKTKK